MLMDFVDIFMDFVDMWVDILMDFMDMWVDTC